MCSFGILRASSTTPEYIEDRGDAYGSSYWVKSISFQYAHPDSGYILVLKPTRIISNYPATSFITRDGISYNPNTKVFTFRVIAVNCNGYFNWEVYELYNGKNKALNLYERD